MLSDQQITQYLEALDLTLPKKPTLKFVQKLQAEHNAKFCFSNLALVLGEPISLNTDDIHRKIIKQRMGGYCFEHNKLIFETLKTLGFTVELIMARVLINKQIENPRTHRITLLSLDNATYIVDVGFGADCPILPLKLALNEDQTAGMDTYRFISNAFNEYELQVLRADGYFSLYRFEMAHYTDADCLAANYYTSTFPNSGFVNNLVVSKKNDRTTILIKNNEFIVREKNNESTIFIENANELLSLLKTHFSIALDEDEAHQLFSRFLAKR